MITVKVYTARVLLLVFIHLMYMYPGFFILWWAAAGFCAFLLIVGSPFRKWEICYTDLMAAFCGTGPFGLIACCSRSITRSIIRQAQPEENCPTPQKD